MPNTPVSIERFSGLNLIDDPGEIGSLGSVMQSNVVLDANGRLRTRDGSSSVYTQSTANMSNIYWTGSQIMVALTANSVKAISTAGSVVASASIGGYSQFVNARHSGTTYTYYTDEATAQVKRWDGAAFSSPAGLATYKGRYLAVQPNDDRLVIADATAKSKLWFSDPGTAETIGVNNFVELTPSDGQDIQGMAVWNNQLFVFKQSKFFVFYGNSTNSSGQPIFNFRVVDTGVGANTGGQAITVIAVHPTGIYFLNERGIYRTQGGPPEPVSRNIGPVFPAYGVAIPGTFTGSTISLGTATLWASGDMLYIGTSGTSTYVLDIPRGEWLHFEWGTLGGVASTGSTSPNFYFVKDTGSGTRYQLHKANGPTYTDDAGTAIVWSYTSAQYDLGYPGQVKITAESRMWGTGSATLQVANDYGSMDTGSALTLGVLATLDAWQQIDREGTMFQHKLSGSGVASVSRLVHYVSFIKPAGVG